MKKSFFILFLFSITEIATAQVHVKDSLLTLLMKTKEDTTRVNLLFDLSYYYDRQSKLDSTILWATQGLTLAQKIGYKKDEMNRKIFMAYKSWAIGDFSTAITLSYPIYEYGKSIDDATLMWNAYGALISSYRDQGDYREALKLGWEGKNIIEAKKDSFYYSMIYATIGSIHFGLERYDSAYIFLNKAIKVPKPFNNENGWISLMFARALEKLNNDNGAIVYFRQSIEKLIEQNNLKDLAGAYNSLALLYEKKSQSDSAIFYANKALGITQENKFNKEKAEAYLIFSRIYEKEDPSLAFDYYKLATSTRDSLYNLEKQRQISSFKFGEELRQNEIKNSEKQFRNRIKTNILLGLSGSFLVFLILLFRNFKNKQKANLVLEKTLSELKSTQAQLIQSEKLASLGELTSGIAHEIQNPLNFVNNFSEVSAELMEELKWERSKVKGERDETVEEEIIGDVIQNLEKINLHGKRADSIVKGMLEHSKRGSGQREQTNLNALADDFLRMTYQSFLAKDPNFKVELQTNLDPDLPKISVIPQDIGKVLVNLYSNAFYVVNERSKTDPNFQPLVELTSRNLGGKIEVGVKDNGPGIHSSIKDKIFQPFFTTKPTGQGTGLGLSLSYDIVKAHGGELIVETKGEKGTTFIIKLPTA